MNGRRRDAPGARRRAETAHHEAGHAVAAFAHRITVEAVTIVPGEGFHGKVTTVQSESWRHARHRAENHALMCLAGPAAHARFLGRAKWPTGCDHDLNAAFAWLTSESGDQREANAWIRLVGERARLFVAADREWSQIRALANALLERDTLSGRAARAVVSRVG